MHFDMFKGSRQTSIMAMEQSKLGAREPHKVEVHDIYCDVKKYRKFQYF